MRYLVLPLFLVACETTESTGRLFEPVETTTRVSAEDPGGVDLPDDPRFDFDEFEISSEELHASAFDHKVAPAETVHETADDPPTPEPTPEPAPTAAPPTPAAPATVVTIQRPAVQQGWPVRLVRTLPETQPPRAILGLPDGQELVVKPGTMVPDHGIVVISIGRGQVELARVAAKGDHATVASQTLTSQY